jgi:NAD dependent epimerase/dehydratase
MSSGGMRGKRVLVTGAGGFIGSHLAERLVDDGAQVRAFVHYNALGSWGWLDHSPKKGELEVVAGDIADSESMAAAVAGVDVVFHLAALIAIPYSYVAPRSYVRTNVEGTLNVLEAARRHGCERVLVTSTSEVYGTARIVPIPESHPLQGQSPYSASKIGADKIAESYFASFSTPVTVVRPFNTFGPRQSARAVLPTIITQLLVGDTVKLGSTTPTRDLNYVDNTVDAFVAVASEPKAIGQTLNFGSGREISVGDLVHVVAKALGKEARIVSEEQRVRPANSEVERLLADASQANALLGWSAKVTLEEGIARTLSWLEKNQGFYRPGRYER